MISSSDELLSEILDCGVFGNVTQAQKTAVQMTGAALSHRDDTTKSKYMTLLYTIFPSKSWMSRIHPELKEKPWLLPICWAKRWGRFLAHNKANGGNLASESMKISKRRIELLKKIRYSIAEQPMINRLLFVKEQFIFKPCFLLINSVQ